MYLHIYILCMCDVYIKKFLEGNHKENHKQATLFKRVTKTDF